MSRPIDVIPTIAPTTETMIIINITSGPEFLSEEESSEGISGSLGSSEGSSSPSSLRGSSDSS
ncbi:hypothetical protein LCGC14_0944540 [marine sediment metagenome]|uniref:Uncharacterized protein n=1 Tax=marine sediment metagenome TaxID=412755 RepID=A0A0F9NJ25_9ZZZZ